VENALSRSGFEVAHRLSLSRLAEEQLEVKAPAMEVLFFNHPLLLLQYSFAGGDPALLFPFVAILRGHGRSTLLCLCSAWPAQGFRPGSLSTHLAKLTERKLDQAALRLETVTQRACPRPPAHMEQPRQAPLLPRAAEPAK
jgi:hypothetical protein